MTAAAIYLDRPVRYADALRLQEALVSARQADAIPDTVLFLEHAPVITLGRRGRSNFLLVSPDQLKQQGIDFHTASRGGDVTYHGPGQLVIYPILKLGGAEADSRRYLSNLEEIAVRTAADFGVTAYRREGKNGAWTDAGKIAAIGFHLKRWVSMHGMSFNVHPDLRGFDLIVGCGLVGEPVSSLQRALGDRTPTVAQVRATMARHVAGVLGRPLMPPPGEVSRLLAEIPNLNFQFTNNLQTGKFQ